MPSNYLLFDYPAFDVTLNKLGRVKLSLTKNHFYDIPEIEINLTNADIYNILLLLKQKEEWVKVIKRIIEAEPNTCVGKGSCPFPFRCKYWFTCKRDYCETEALWNGEPS